MKRVQYIQRKRSPVVKAYYSTVCIGIVTFARAAIKKDTETETEIEPEHATDNDRDTVRNRVRA